MTTMNPGQIELTLIFISYRERVVVGQTRNRK